MEPPAAKAAVRKSAVTYSFARCIYCSPDRNPWNLNFEITVDIIVRIARLQSCPLQHILKRVFT